jgi:hypothetical protein
MESASERASERERKKIVRRKKDLDFFCFAFFSPLRTNSPRAASRRLAIEENELFSRFQTNRKKQKERIKEFSGEEKKTSLCLCRRRRDPLQARRVYLCALRAPSEPDPRVPLGVPLVGRVPLPHERITQNHPFLGSGGPREDRGDAHQLGVLSLLGRDLLGPEPGRDCVVDAVDDKDHIGQGVYRGASPGDVVVAPLGVERK